MTDAEMDMRGNVQNLRDRLKSGLLGWSENIRLQYDHLTARSREAASLSATNRHLYSHVPEEHKQTLPASLSASEVMYLVGVLKEEKGEIDELVHAVERFNLLSASSSSLLY